MIAFGVAIADRAIYERHALPGLERAAEPDSLLLSRSGLPIRDAYNQLAAEAAGHDDLEALVLLHQDLELTDDSLPRRVRRLFADPRAGLIGTLGVSGMALHLRLGAKDLYGVVRTPRVEHRFSTGPDEVEQLDGALLALAPWVVRGLRFATPRASEFHGYDSELSLWVAAHGGRVVCEDIPHLHHRVEARDFTAQARAAAAVAQAWDPALRPREWAPAFQR